MKEEHIKLLLRVGIAVIVGLAFILMPHLLAHPMSQALAMIAGSIVSCI